MVAIGGALGSVARYALTGLVPRLTGETFPWGTVIVNISGSFVIGLLQALSQPGERSYVSPNGRLFLMYGVCGGYTTFSSFSLQTLQLLQERDLLKACGNVAASVVLCLVAVWLGYLLGETLNSTKGA